MKPRILSLGTVLILSLLSGTARAQAPEQAVDDPVIVEATPPPADGQGPTDPAELEAYLDGLMRAHMDAHDVAGATIAVVRDGGVLFSR